MECDISGIFQGDLIIKTAIELGLEDMRSNPWLIEDVFSSLLNNPILKSRYGYKEIARAKEFILNNKIPIYMYHRIDKMEYPCITIHMGPSSEDEKQATLGDGSVCYQDYDPSDIAKTIPYIIPPFNPVSYDKATGIIQIPTDIADYQYIEADMVVVDPKTGNGWIISGKTSNNGIQIDSGVDLPSGEIAIIPAYQIWRARRERIVSQEQYNIGCHVHGDVSYLIFLSSVVKYCLFRYREGLLEFNNFQSSTLAVSDIVKNSDLDVENVYSRWITLKGQTEESWVKTPQRFLESIGINSKDGAQELTTQGIKIISQKEPPGVEEDDALWITIDE